jgi:hypothetical protein
LSPHFCSLLAEVDVAGKLADRVDGGSLAVRIDAEDANLPYLSLYEHQIEHELVIWRPIDRLSTLRFQ